MSIPVLSFFNHRGGVGKTSLVYHLAWMFSELGRRVLALDLDPQANLTTAFLDEDALERIWLAGEGATTIFRCIEPLPGGGDSRQGEILPLGPTLGLIPGDLALATLEDTLAARWLDDPRGDTLYRQLRVLSAFWQVAQEAAARHEADLILFDVGPNLGAINRSALIASDAIIIPLGADLVALQGLHTLGPTLRAWRSDWQRRLDHCPDPSCAVPLGRMAVLGYIAEPHPVRLSRPVTAFTRWLDRIPAEYRQSLLGETQAEPPAIESDPYCLAQLRHYHSLLSLAREARKPMFRLTVADGAMGAHANAVGLAYGDFRALALKILERIVLGER